MAVPPPTPPGNSPMMAPPGAPPKLPTPPGVPGAPVGQPGKMGPPQPNAKGVAGPPKAGGKPGEPAEGEEVFAPTLTFWQQSWVQNLLPFITSLAAHAAILIIGIVATAAATGNLGKIAEVFEEQTIIPESQMSETTPGGVPNVGTGGDPMKQAMQEEDPNKGSDAGWASKEGPNLDPAATGGGSDSNEAGAAVIGGFGGMGSGAGIGGGKGGGSGAGTGDGGPLARFGQPGGGAIGPKGPVFGNGGNARKIVFICDATGTMINKFASLKDQLAKAIAGLKPVQSFNVVFYYDGSKFSALDNNQLLPATPDNKRKAFAFLDGITTTGTTDPIPAIEVAFKMAPQLVYFLSDGEFNNVKTYEEVTAAMDRSNKENKIKVNTILFDGFEEKAAEVMQSMSTKTGGKYVHVKESDLPQ